jgi:TolB-like protein/tetratricopeptide (TPR) repeat protein
MEPVASNRQASGFGWLSAGVTLRHHDATGRMAPLSFIGELKRRNVVRVGTAYVALGWVIVQVSQTVVPLLNLPEWTTSLLVWIGAVGLPFVLVFSWAYELTPDGLRREAEVDRAASITHQTSRRLDYVIIGLLALAIGLFALDRFVHRDAQAPAEIAGATAGGPGPGRAAQPGRKSIAVLPFVNMSDDKDNEFFGDGLAEELLNLLAKVPELRVAARTSSFHFKGKDPTIAEVATALQVETVLEGSVRRSGDTIRVVAQLISADDGTHLWSEKYDRPLTDIFAVQDDIAGHIVAALLPHLGADEARLATSDSGQIPPALFERFLRARHRYYDKTQPAFTFARQEFLAITEAAPGYAPAWAWLARTWMATCVCAGGDVPEDVSYARAQESIDTALRLNPREAVAVLAQGALRRRQGRNEEALVEFDRALALDPMLVDAHIGRERLLAFTGRADDAIRGLEKARAIDPLHPEVLYELAHLLNLQGAKREAFAAVEQLYEINPANARELEMHLYSDNDEIARMLYLADGAVRDRSKDFRADDLGWLYLNYGFRDHPTVQASSYAPVALALAGRRDAALQRLREQGKSDATFDAELMTRVVLGDLAVARDLLWQKWSALEVKVIGPQFGPYQCAILIALLQQTGRAGDAAAPIRALEQTVARLSPLHQANYRWFQARLHLAHGDKASAIAAYQAIAAAGGTGDRLTGGVDILLGDLATDPRLQPVARQMDANFARQMAELERLRASGMDAAAARREYVARLPQDRR